MENQRIRLTKKMIQESLLSLLDEKKFEKISVKELCEKATVNRTTFYKYYGSPSDVVNEIIHDIFDEIYKISLHWHDSKLMQREMLTFLEKNRHKCLTLIDKLPYEMFIKRLFELDFVNQNSYETISDAYTNRQKEYLIRYHQAGYFGVISNWLHDEHPISIDELLGIFSGLSDNILFKDEQNDLK